MSEQQSNEPGRPIPKLEDVIPRRLYVAFCAAKDAIGRELTRGPLVDAVIMDNPLRIEGAELFTMDSKMERLAVWAENGWRATDGVVYSQVHFHTQPPKARGDAQTPTGQQP